MNQSYTHLATVCDEHADAVRLQLRKRYPDKKVVKRTIGRKMQETERCLCCNQSWPTNTIAIRQKLNEISVDNTTK